jgi:hypothetical protein
MWLNPGYQEQIRRAITRPLFPDLFQASSQESGQKTSKKALRRDTMAHAFEQAATPRLARALWLALWLLGFVAVLIGNVTPAPWRALLAVHTFQLLLLYWMETVVLALWTLMR